MPLYVCDERIFASVETRCPVAAPLVPSVERLGRSAERRRVVFGRDGSHAGRRSVGPRRSYPSTHGAPASPRHHDAQDGPVAREGLCRPRLLTHDAQAAGGARGTPSILRILAALHRRRRHGACSGGVPCAMASCGVFSFRSPRPRRPSASARAAAAVPSPGPTRRARTPPRTRASTALATPERARPAPIRSSATASSSTAAHPEPTATRRAAVRRTAGTEEGDRDGPPAQLAHRLADEGA